ncbi:histidinol dehydrogenase [Flavobacterium akiainvivens]|uniref:Histidinol dehydrogenase n=1 Tax=Flavobacterium akiainvivens TaxID=1202724 RepID=A0A0M8MGD4_9FLAO|nr:histidinol dehydrogenase [Flavobacterium akiainvivens]KOS05701.1 histidinol dehydrogenase [Flavobacterium akiainvivens]SFQ36921.1 histidinol dehydrogenase [Flavobacterium akiainvivens]
MKTCINPTPQQWAALCQRPQIAAENLEELTRQVFTEIQRNGDVAVAKYTGIFDGIVPNSLALTAAEIAAGAQRTPAELQAAIQLAKANIEKFHTAQIEQKQIIETTPGVACWRESRGIERVGIYIPGGSAPLFSTVLMLAIPAQIAGCKEIILCTPPDKQGNINPAILYAAQLTGITAVYRVGGIQAIGALAIGTQSIPKVDKIFGPGNQYVTAAKQTALNYGVAIDLPAGPSELLVIADDTANPEYVAADLLSQAEHGPDSQVILLSNSEVIVANTLKAIDKQVKALPRKEIALKALQNSKAIVLGTLAECLDFSNAYAPEHLILNCRDAEKYGDKITNAGSVFLGNYSCESAGDYASGTNHTLPTNGYARSYSGVSVDSFIKKITFQKISKEGLQAIGPAIEAMAAAEQLQAHKNAVSIRLKDLKNV